MQVERIEDDARGRRADLERHGFLAVEGALADVGNDGNVIVTRNDVFGEPPGGAVEGEWRHWSGGGRQEGGRQ